MKTAIYDIFASYQGEGLFAGQKQIFIRFKGCNLRCNYCDELSSKLSPVNFQKISYSDIKKIKMLIEHEKTNIISFTGGEPLIYSEIIKDITEIFGKNYKYLLETNGILHERFKLISKVMNIVSMDIKLPQYCDNDYFDEYKKFLKIISVSKTYIKIVFDENVDIKDFKKAVEMISRKSKYIPLFIQPVTSKNGKIKVNLKLVDKLYGIAKNRLEDVRFLPQIHKLLGIK